MEGLVGVLLGLVALTNAFPAYPNEDQDYIQMVARMAAAKGGDLFDRGYEEYPYRQYPNEGYEGEYPPEVQDLKNWELRQGKGFDQGAQLMEEEDLFDGKLRVVKNWPIHDLKLGQIGGVAVCPEGYPHVFHRGDRTWGKDFFEPTTHKFTKKEDGPINEATVLRLNGTNGVVLDKWGEGLFYLPHGLTIDKDNNFWMTDVAMHQVFKFKSGEKKPSLVLGKEFEPAQGNDDEERFCEPTDVVVASNGDFFVADGYCNTRVVKYNAKGERIGQFGMDDLDLPHSLALIESENLICVADRENFRVICYDAGLEDEDKEENTLGEYIIQYDVKGNVYAIDYSPVDKVLYGLSWADVATGFTIDVTENFPNHQDDLIATWSPNGQGFDSAHDLAVSPDGSAVYVGEVESMRDEDPEETNVLDAETMNENEPTTNLWKMVKATGEEEEEEEELEELRPEEDEEEEEEEEEEE